MLGSAWTVLQPLLMTGIYYFIFGFLFKTSTIPNYAIFVLIGIILAASGSRSGTLVDGASGASGASGVTATTTPSTSALAGAAVAGVHGILDGLAGDQAVEELGELSARAVVPFAGGGRGARGGESPTPLPPASWQENPDRSPRWSCRYR